MDRVDSDRTEGPAGNLAHETPKEKSDRQFVELLSELRVALPGAQFLFAFLLAVPFATRFSAVSHGLRLVFYACLLFTVVATVMLMAPVVHHRVRWQRGNKTEVIRVAHELFLAGMVSLGVAMITAVLFVSHVLLGTIAAVVATVVSSALLLLTWFLVPLRGRLHPRPGE